MLGFLTVVAALYTTTAAAAENGLILRGSFGVTAPLGPDYLTTYWQPGLQVNAGMGAQLDANLAVFVCFVHHSYDYDDGQFEATGEHASVNELMLYMKKSILLDRFRTFQPFYSFSVGVSLLSTPAMYKAADISVRPNERRELLEPSQADSGLSTGAGLGIIFFAEEQTELFLELISRTGFLNGQNFISFCGRAGVSFGM